MPYTIIIFISRKPELTPSSFKHCYETVHVPLLKKITGEDFPLSHTRHYIEKGDVATSQDDDYLFASQENSDYDVVTVYTFANREHWMRFLGKCESNINFGRIRDAERKIIKEGGTRMLRMGDTRSTGKNGGEVGWQFVGSV